MDAWVEKLCLIYPSNVCSIKGVPMAVEGV
jgi:hypothetical protein